MMDKISKVAQVIIITLGLFILILSNPPQVLAGAIYTDQPIPDNYVQCSLTAPGCAKPDGSDYPPFCWNSERAGVTDCGPACEAGDPWTKYEYKGCWRNALDPRSPCNSYYQETQEAVCSTADKCTSESNNPYLNSGSCSCTTGGIYKTCCSNTSPSYVISDARSTMPTDSCVQLSVDTTNPPYEGVCPAGSQPKFCGFGGYPACGQEACGPVTLPPSPPIGFLCGDGFCESFLGENSTNCPQDCAPPAPVCGNGTCEAGEDSGNCPSDCPAAPPPATTASCTVSWNLSNTNPPANSTITANVTGTAITNSSWTNVAYSLDNGGWNTGVQVTSSGATPTFRFSVPSGAASGTHSLRFAIGNGSTVCTPTGSFVTQAPAAWLPPTCTNITFSGCSLQGNSRCSDWGSSSYPNWDNSLWNDCQKACTQPNPDNFCLANITTP